MVEQGKKFLGAGSAKVGDVIQADPDRSTKPDVMDFQRPQVNGYDMGPDFARYDKALAEWEAAQPVRYIKVRRVILKEHTHDGETTTSATAIGPYVPAEKVEKLLQEQRARLNTEPLKYDVYG